MGIQIMRDGEFHVHDRRLSAGNMQTHTQHAHKHPLGKTTHTRMYAHTNICAHMNLILVVIGGRYGDNKAH